MTGFQSTCAVARRLNITTQTIRDRAKRDPRHPQPVRLTTRVWVWDVRALEAFYSISFE